MTTQLALATPAVAATGAPAYPTPPAAAVLADGPAELQAAEAAYAQALSHALRARTVEQVNERFAVCDQRMHKLRLLARRAA